MRRARDAREIYSEPARTADRSFADRDQKTTCRAMRGQSAIQQLTVPFDAQAHWRAELGDLGSHVRPLQEQDTRRPADHIATTPPPPPNVRPDPHPNVHLH